jgi:hypothetical protein
MTEAALVTGGARGIGRGSDIGCLWRGETVRPARTFLAPTKVFELKPSRYQAAAVCSRDLGA